MSTKKSKYDKKEATEMTGKINSPVIVVDVMDQVNLSYRTQTTQIAPT